MNTEQVLQSKEKRRTAAENRYLDRFEKREAKARNLLGELIRDGQQVFYIQPRAGKCREGTPEELIDFLIRNRYV